MDFSDIASYPSPNSSTRAHIQSTDSRGCEQYLITCSKLIGILSDREIDIRSVHYKYRLERFHRSRSKVVRRFYEAYEARFPELAIPKDQVFIYEPNGNIRIDTSHPTTCRKSPSPETSSSPSSSSSERLRKSSIRRNQCKQSSNIQDHQPSCEPLSCWTVATYCPPAQAVFESAPSSEDTIRHAPIPLPWIVKREKHDLTIECDLRCLYQQCACSDPFECDLRPLFYDPVCVEPDLYIAPLFVDLCEEHLPHGSLLCDERIETLSDDSPARLYFPAICDERAIAVVFALMGMILFLMCYACLGEVMYPSAVWCTSGLPTDDELHTHQG